MKRGNFSVVVRVRPGEVGGERSAHQRRSGGSRALNAAEAGGEYEDDIIDPEYKARLSVRNPVLKVDGNKIVVDTREMVEQEAAQAHSAAVAARVNAAGGPSGNTTPRGGGTAAFARVNSGVSVRSGRSAATDATSRSARTATPQPSTQHKTLRVRDKSYTYHRCFASESTHPEYGNQRSLFNEIGMPIIDKAMQGMNGTVLAYGQTGSGKTYSMLGPNLHDFQEVDQYVSGKKALVRAIDGSSDRGLILRIADELFARIEAEMLADPDVTFKVGVLYYQIYNDKVFSLLGDNHKQELKVKCVDRTRAFVKDLEPEILPVGYPSSRGGARGGRDSIVPSKEAAYAAFLRLIQIGTNRRECDPTIHNVQSSRSHAIMTLEIEKERRSTGERIWCSKMNLVDLAGSERLGRLEISEKRQREACKINNSLSVLNRCIIELTKNGKHAAPPFRDSPLTNLLRDSFGGNSMTIMLATISPLPKDIDETISTLEYSAMAKKIQNKPKVNSTSRQAETEALRMRCKLLEDELAMYRANPSAAPPGAMKALEDQIDNENSYQRQSVGAAWTEARAEEALLEVERWRMKLAETEEDRDRIHKEMEMWRRKAEAAEDELRSQRMRTSNRREASLSPKRVAPLPAQATAMHVQNPLRSANRDVTHIQPVFSDVVSTIETGYLPRSEGTPSQQRFEREPSCEDGRPTLLRGLGNTPGIALKHHHNHHHDPREDDVDDEDEFAAGGDYFSGDEENAAVAMPRAVVQAHNHQHRGAEPPAAHTATNPPSALTSPNQADRRLQFSQQQSDMMRAEDVEVDAIVDETSSDDSDDDDDVPQIDFAAFQKLPKEERDALMRRYGLGGGGAPTGKPPQTPRTAAASAPSEANTDVRTRKTSKTPDVPQRSPIVTPHGSRDATPNERSAATAPISTATPNRQNTPDHHPPVRQTLPLVEIEGPTPETKRRFQGGNRSQESAGSEGDEVLLTPPRTQRAGIHDDLELSPESPDDLRAAQQLIDESRRRREARRATGPLNEEEQRRLRERQLEEQRQARYAIRDPYVEDSIIYQQMQRSNRPPAHLVASQQERMAKKSEAPPVAIKSTHQQRASAPSAPSTYSRQHGDRAPAASSASSQRSAVVRRPVSSRSEGPSLAEMREARAQSARSTASASTQQRSSRHKDPSTGRTRSPAASTARSLSRGASQRHEEQAERSVMGQPPPPVYYDGSNMAMDQTVKSRFLRDPKDIEENQVAAVHKTKPSVRFYTQEQALGDHAVNERSPSKRATSSRGARGSSQSSSAWDRLLDSTGVADRQARAQKQRRERSGSSRRDAAEVAVRMEDDFQKAMSTINASRTASQAPPKVFH